MAKKSFYSRIPPSVRIASTILLTATGGYLIWDKFIRDKPDKLDYDKSNFTHTEREMEKWISGLFDSMRGLFDGDKYFPYWDQLVDNKFNGDELRFMNNYWIKSLDDDNSIYDWVESQWPDAWSYYPVQDKVLQILLRAGIAPVNTSTTNAVF